MKLNLSSAAAKAGVKAWLTLAIDHQISNVLETEKANYLIIAINSNSCHVSALGLFDTHIVISDSKVGLLNFNRIRNIKRNRHHFMVCGR